MKHHRRDLPVFRRYLNAFIETSMPTLALGVQMTHMGDERALSFVIPMFYFMFIILSTLRPEFLAVRPSPDSSPAPSSS